MAPDFEPMLYSFLAKELPDVRISTQVPKTMPDELVTFRRTGTWSIGDYTENVDRPVIEITAWAKDESGARKLSRRVRKSMLSLIYQQFFAFCNQTNNYPSADENGTPQYISDYQLVVSGNPKED